MDAGLSEAELAERAVVGSVVLDSSVFPFAAEFCTPDDFQSDTLSRIYGGVGALRTLGEPVDAIVVNAKLGEWGVRGVSAAFVFDLIGSVPTAANVGFYARRVRGFSVARRVRSVAAGLLDRVRDVEHGSEALQWGIEQLKSVSIADDIADYLQTLRELLAASEDDTDSYDWVIPGLLEKKDRLILTGQEGAGKTTLARMLAIFAAAGVHPFTFEPIKPIKVLVVDAENSEQQWRRSVRPTVMEAQRKGQRDPLDHVWIRCTSALDITKDKTLAMIHRFMDEVEPDLMLIGPLYRLVPGALQSDSDAAPVLSALGSLKDRGAALIIEAHAGHAVGSSGKRDLRPRGSSALLGWPEFGLGLRAESEETVEVVRWRGDRDKRDWPRRLVRSERSRIFVSV